MDCEETKIIKEESVACKSLIGLLSQKCVNMIVSEINKPELQFEIKHKIIIPVINMIYIELRPYVLAMIISICSILILSLLTFLLFIFHYFRKV